MARGYARSRGKGKWQLEVDLGSYKDPETGKRVRNKKYKTIQAKGQRDADKQLTKFVAKVTGDNYLEPEKISFVDFVNNHWLPKCGKRRLAHTTLETHIRYLELRILPAFQYFRLDQIKPMHIIDFLDNLQEDGMRLDKKKDKDGSLITRKGRLSSSTIHYHYRILNNIFNFAVEVQFLEESPLKGVQKPSQNYKETDVYDTEEAYKLLRCLESEVDVPHWQIIIKLAITTGMRRSELFGLEFKHIDLEEKVIHVRQALTYSKENGYQLHEIKKGNRSAKKRDIVLSESLIKPIKTLKAQRNEERLAAKELWRGGKHNLLLADENGKPFHPESMKNWWKRFLKRHDLKYINIHALRHTSATLLINEGVHAKIISERLGHSDIKTTMNIYGHALKQADEIASAKLDDVLFGNSKTQ
jgi:integrase